MPTYEYHCSANGATLAVRHGMNEAVTTWGELCERAQIAQGDTPVDAGVTKVFTTSNVIRRENLGSGAAPMPACGGGGCGGGMCQFE